MASQTDGLSSRPTAERPAVASTSLNTVGGPAVLVLALLPAAANPPRALPTLVAYTRIGTGATTLASAAPAVRASVARTTATRVA